MPQLAAHLETFIQLVTRVGQAILIDEQPAEVVQWRRHPQVVVRGGQSHAALEELWSAVEFTLVNRKHGLIVQAARQSQIVLLRLKARFTQLVKHPRSIELGAIVKADSS